MMSDTDEGSWYTNTSSSTPKNADSDLDVSSSSGCGQRSQSDRDEGSRSNYVSPRKPKPLNKLNAFACFMRSRRAELEAEGKKFANGWKSVADALTDEWAALPEHLKETYRVKAKKLSEEGPSREKAKVSAKPQPHPSMVKLGTTGPFTMLCYYEVNPSDSRMNSFGISFNQLKITDIEIRQRLADHRAELRGILNKEDPKLVNFILIKFTPYVNDDQGVQIPAEIGVTAFSVGGGIIDNFATFIDVCEIPTGNGFIARDACNCKSLPYPPFDNRLQNYKVLAHRLEKFVQQHSFPHTRKLKLYCMPADIREVNGCLRWIYSKFQGPCPLEIFSFTEAMLMLMAVISDLQLPNFAGDRIALHERMVAARISRDSAGDKLSLTSGYLYDESDSSKSKKGDAWGRIKGHGKVQNGPRTPGITSTEDESSGPSFGQRRDQVQGHGQTTTSGSTSRGQSGHGRGQIGPSGNETSPSGISFGANGVVPKFPMFPYSASIASSSRSMRPVGMPVADWTQIRAGCFLHERQVQDYLGSFDLAFENVLSCPWHMNPKFDSAMAHCPLNVTNRMAYNMLDVLTPVAEVNPQLTFHVPAIGPEVEDNEIRRREHMLKNWVLVIRSDKDFKYEPTVMPPYFVKVKEKGTIPSVDKKLGEKWEKVREDW